MMRWGYADVGRRGAWMDYALALYGQSQWKRSLV